ncbi:hypothetical protein A3860_08075 [Niastella vici]|uniref:Lipoprotein n=1 Tax=Niastella vici TaxID=1703345 RepID=A0A1V9FJ11_9BACT|nr:hypothetical protein [Niastella vici]OQP58267.1 hypothetical protein A3860_08075 [Niastella vici]
MKYKILLPLLMSGVLFNACSKTDDKPIVDTKPDTILESYYPGSSMDVVELAIYTRDTMINNPEVIRSFIDRNVSADAKNSFYLGVSSIPVPESNARLDFLNDNRVRYNGINMQIMGYKDSTILISEYTSSPMPSGGSSCAVLLNKIPEYNPYTDCPDGNCSTYRKTTPLLINGANYIAPLLTYAVKTSDCAATLSEIPAINIKNGDLRSSLGTGDSVLIQYVNLPLVKK